MAHPQARAPIHYGWHVVWAGSLCVFACIGLGRFALGMLLPAMGESLHLSYSQMGLLGTMNFLGYLIAVLLCGPLTDRLGPRRFIFLALLAVGLTMILIGRARNFWAVMLLYTITGMGSGGANVPIMALVSSWFSRTKRGKATGFVVIGSGFAILLSGKLVPYLNTLGGAAGWRLGWQVLGFITLMVSGICLLVLRNSPKEMGLRPYGGHTAAENDLPGGPGPRTDKKAILHLGAIYFLFGYTYVIYATFIVTTLINEHGFTESAAGNFWALVGFLSLFSGPIFGTLSDKIGRKISLAMVFGIQTAAYLLVAFRLPPVFLNLSIGCFGIVAWSIPSIMAALVGDFVGPRKAARVFGFITFIFSLGQIAGPAMAGMLAEQSGSFDSSFLMAGGCTMAGALLSLRLKAPSTPGS